MNKTARSSKCISHQGRLEEVFADDESRDKYAAAERSEIVLVGSSHLLVQAMGAQALQDVGGAPRGEAIDVCAQIGGAKAEGAESIMEEYPALYARMAELVRQGASDVDLAPMVHVADAFLLGRRTAVEDFEF